MSSINKNKVKRFCALVLAFLLWAGNMPFVNFETTSAEENVIPTTSVSDNQSGVSVLPSKGIYTITVGELTNGYYHLYSKGEEVDDGFVEEGEPAELVITPHMGYKVETLMITKDGEAWQPMDGDNWWHNCTDSYTGIVGLTFEEVDANYHVEIVFAERAYTINYAITENGKLTFNASNSDSQQVVNGPIMSEVVQVNSSTMEYHITAGVIDNTYHLTQVVVNGVNQIATQDINNDLETFDILCYGTSAYEYTVQVYTAKDSYGVDIVTEGKGEVEITSGNCVNTLYGSDVTFCVKPNKNYQVAAIYVNDTELAPSQCVLDSNGYYSYTISNITEYKVVEVVFEKIPTTWKFFNESGIVARNEKGKRVYPDTRRNIYGGTITLTMGENIDLALDASAAYSDSITITESMKMDEFYIRDNTHDTFGTEKRIHLYGAVEFYVDEIDPSMTFTDMEKEIWVSSQQESVELRGQANDDNLDRVVWSTVSLDETAILASDNYTCDFVTDIFVISNVPMNMDEETNVFYLYAVDKAEHCSQEYTVTVYRDGLAPEMTDVSLNAPDMNKQAYGNFSNGSLEITIFTKDIQNKSGVKWNASGIDKIQMYVGNMEQPICTVNASQTVRGTDTVQFVIQLSEQEKAALGKLQDVFIKVVDSMGNESEPYRISDFDNAGVTSNQFMFEQEAPKIKIPYVEDGAYIKETENGVEYWYKDIPNVNYTASDMSGEDKGSGLGIRQVVLNGETIEQCTKDDYATVASYDDVVQVEENVVSSEDLAVMVAGQNDLEIIFTDLAGNVGSDAQTLYLDNHVPEITSFAIVDSDNVMTADVHSGMAFGNFHNGTVQIVVAAQDTYDVIGEEVPSAGLQAITLYLDGEAYATQSVNEQGIAIFQLPSETILDEEKVYLDTIVTATVTDMVNNESEAVDMTTGNEDILSSKLMIETVKPKMSIIVADNAYLTEDGIAYINEATNISVKVADKESGLQDVVIAINQDEVVTQEYPVDAAAMQESDSFDVVLKNQNANEDNLYEMTAIVVDNAGNAQTASQTVYFDTTAPVIKEINMQSDGVIESDGTISPVAERDYGYYFKEDTIVTIYATDGEMASAVGVKEIQYYTIDSKGNRSETKTVAVDEKNSISFVIEKGFKGQVYACAYDMLMNVEEHFVTPHALLIETPEQHAMEEHVTFTKADAPYSTSDGGELYAQDVDVTLTVQDTFSGIREVEWSVDAPYDTSANQSGQISLSNQGTFTADSNTDGWTIDTTDKNLVTKMHKTLKVANNSNDIVVKAKVTDRTGYVVEKELKFSIDKTNPIVEITFDDIPADSEYTDMYKENRTATITVKERNFSADAITASITNKDGGVPSISEWSTSVNNENPDETVNTATVVFSEDGDYSMEMSCHDVAQNASETVTVTPFTIDKTVPVVSVTYDNNQALNGNYYAQTRVATISVTEHNFIDQRATIIGTATNGGEPITFPSINGWSQNGDVYTTSIVYDGDGLYQFDVECSDKAGNVAEKYMGEAFYIDKTVPIVEILGVENESANNGVVAPKISLTDLNYDVNGVTIELVGANRGAVSMEGGFVTQFNGQLFSYADFPTEQVNDDIYTLTATLRDMAGNETTQSITFSVNRFGSVYAFDSSLQAIAGTYIQEPIDVRLTEVNVDSLDHDTIKVVVDMNGTPRDLVEGKDYTVQESGGYGNWYKYSYTIDKSVFSGDGRYIVTVYSQDKAGNINENIDESKKAEISFGVDQTAPVIIPIDIDSNMQYAVDVKEANITVNDNLVLESVEIFVGDEKCDYSVTGENYTFSIPGADEPQNITIVAVDAAGNKTSHVISDVLVTTNAFVRWYNNKPLVAGTVAGVTVVSGGGIGIGAFLRRRKFLIV